MDAELEREVIPIWMIDALLENTSEQGGFSYIAGLDRCLRDAFMFLFCTSMHCDWISTTVVIDSKERPDYFGIVYTIHTLQYTLFALKIHL